MKHLFAGFIRYTEEEFNEIWENAIFVVDTNVLLNFYKYSSMESTKSLLNILKKLKDKSRLWIPHQVALEYFFNYENNMFKQHEGYNLLVSELEKIKGDSRKALSTVQSKHPYIKTDKYHFYLDDIDRANKQIQEQLDNEIASLPDFKKIEEDLLILLDGIIGEPFNQERINKIEKEGQERFNHKIPPGFKDKDNKNKNNYRSYGDFKYQQLYGDLILWNQIIERVASDENPKPVIFITEEKKEDWWEKQGTEIKRPHPNLIQEFLNKTRQKFYMYRTESFVQQAKIYIDPEVTDEQVNKVAREMENIRRFDEQEEKELNTLQYKNEYLDPINVEKDIEIEIEKLLPYLTAEQKSLLLDSIREAFNINLNPDVSKIKYTNAISWGIKAAIPQLEQKLQEKVTELSLKNYPAANSYMRKFAELSNFKNDVEKGLFLFDTISNVETEIIFSSDLPF